MNRGDVILVRFPHPSGLRGKKRPAVIVQSDVYAGTVSTVVVAEVTKNLTRANDPACLFMRLMTKTAQRSGLPQRERIARDGGMAAFDLGRRVARPPPARRARPLDNVSCKCHSCCRSARRG